MWHKGLLLSSATIIGAAFPSVYALGAAIELPAALVPSAQTSIEGILLAVIAIMFKNLPGREQTASMDAKLANIDKNFASLEGAIKEHIREEDMQREREHRDRLRMAEWVGHVSEQLANHGSMIEDIYKTIEGHANKEKNNG